MLLRSITRHVRDQNWFAVFLDFLIVVVGVFIGIQVANWNEVRQERELEHRYLERLETALSEDLEEYDDAVRLAQMRGERARLLQTALSDPDVALNQPSQLFDAVLVAGFTYHPAISGEVFDEMVATGNARIIRDESLRDAIAEYYSSIEAWSQWSYIREHTQLEYMDRRAGILSADESRRLWSEDGDAVFSAEEARSLVERIRATPLFVEWLPYSESWQQTQALDYAELGRMARTLHGRIHDALGERSEDAAR